MNQHQANTINKTKLDDANAAVQVNPLAGELALFDVHNVRVDEDGVLALQAGARLAGDRLGLDHALAESMAEEAAHEARPALLRAHLGPFRRHKIARWG